MTRTLLLFAAFFFLFLPRAEAQSFGRQPIADSLVFPRIDPRVYMPSDHVMRAAAVDEGTVLSYRLVDLRITDYRLTLESARGSLMDLADAAMRGPSNIRETREAYAMQLPNMQIGLPLYADVPMLGLHRGDEVVAFDGWGLAAFDLEIEYPEYVASAPAGFTADLVVYTHGRGLRRVRIYGSGPARA